MLQTIYVLNNEILQFLGLKSAVYNQERVIMAHTVCTIFSGRMWSTARQVKVKSKADNENIFKICIEVIFN